MSKNLLSEAERREIELAHLGLDFNEIDFSKLRDPFAGYYSVENYIELLKVMRDPANFAFTCKHIFNVEPTVFQLVWLEALWNHPYPMIIAGRGASKSFTTALYHCLLATIRQGTKIVIASASFRQAKLVFDYIVNIWQNAPVWRDLLGDAHPSFTGDMHKFVIGRSSIIAIPLGTGEKIRGLRANCVHVEEFNSINKEIFEVVLRGFTATSSNPVDTIKTKAKLKKLQEKGLLTPDLEREILGTHKPNQIILTGTAGWDFQVFSEYHKKYRKIIKSGGDPDQVKEILGNRPDKGFDHRDYCIIRMPADLLPEGMMDDKAIANAKATMDEASYRREFGACFQGGVEIITNKGVKPIKDVKIGDMVLTHKGRFRPVENLYERKYEGDINKISSVGNNQPIIVTPEHPFYTGEDRWEVLDNIDVLKEVCLQELNNNKEIKISEFTTNYNIININHKEYIYPLWGGCCNTHKKPAKKYKTCIPNNIKLDYNFGLIVGYYLSEGNIGSEGKLVEFSLDGHVIGNLQDYINELINAIGIVFEKEPKTRYRQSGSVCTVYVCSRLIADLLKYICPGVSHTKFIQPEILYSNEEFMKGFIVGYWHGDGSVTIDKTRQKLHIKAGCVNKSLLTQVKTVLNYFGIKTSLLNKYSDRVGIFKGKEVNQKANYELNVSWKSHQDFLKLLDDINHYPEKTTKEHTHKIKEITKEQYNDYVYNLHVKEDESYTLINGTVHNCFVKDSNGFYPRSLIESCTCKQPILIGNQEVKFGPRLKGDPAGKYVISIDPAAEQDNLAVVVLENHPDHNRVVYCWTTRRKDLVENNKNKNKAVDEKNYYGFVARKIRNLMKVFPTEYIVIDSQGGGGALNEMLHSPKELEPGELLLWPLREDDPIRFPGFKDYGYDDEAGLHIIELVNASSAEYTNMANQGLKKDMQNKMLLFPYTDAVSLSVAQAYDNSNDKSDTLEDVMIEIELLKDEISSIQHTTTNTGRDRWDAPQGLTPEGKKIVLKKDRFSALLYGNALARRLFRQSTIDYSCKAIGGFTHQFQGQDLGGPLYVGQSAFVEWANQSILGSAVSLERRNDPFGYYHR